MQNLEFIKKFSKITISGVCKNVKVDRANLLSRKNDKRK